MKANYHTHTTRCHHASGSDEQYVRSAIQNGFDVLGFSDHACWKYNTRYKSPIRMTVREFKGYKKSILKLQKKYRDRIDILLGMEAEYYPEYMDWLLDFAIEQDLDYLLFGNHYLGSDEYGQYCGALPRDEIDAYFDSCIAGMETGMFSCLCHPELPLRDEKGWDAQLAPGWKRVCEAAKRLDIPLEYNCLGLQSNFSAGFEMYPHHKFWEIAAQTGCTAIIGMDAHHPDDLHASLYRHARSYLADLGIKVVDEIPLVDFRALKAQKQSGNMDPSKKDDT